MDYGYLACDLYGIRDSDELVGFCLSFFVTIVITTQTSLFIFILFYYPIPKSQDVEVGSFR